MATDLVQRKMNGALYRQARAARGLEQFEVAVRLNVSQSKVSQVERGDSEYSTAEKQAFAELIGVPLPALLDWLGYNVGPQPLSWREWYAQALSEGQQTIARPTTSTSDSPTGAWGDTLRQTRGSADSPAPKPAARQRNQGFSHFPAIPIGAR